uniref:Capid protein VP1 n=30 Tax=Norwalk virus TaxID=11983 RepID=A0A1B4WGK7_NORV|nr:capid protein VP1 [Norovirus Hu/GI/45-5/Tokyo/1977/JPN]
MMMASKDAPSNMDGTSGAGQLVPEANTAEPINMESVVGAATATATAGQVNLIDPWIMNNYVQAPQGEFTISPNNTPGDVLFDLQLGPHLNPFLSHLSRMYNGWVGNMKVRVMLARNAISAGKIIICCISPGFTSQSISIAQATMFPHVIADVRVLEPIDVPLDDVRNVLFHNNDHAHKMRLLCMLYTPLRTGASSSGSDPFVIAGRVLTCPTQDFNFLFLVPPDVEQKTKPFSVPNIPLNLMSNSRVPALIDGMTVSSDQNQVVQFQNGRVTLDGQLQGTTAVSASCVAKIRGRIFSNASHYGINLTEVDGTQYHAFDSPAPLGFPDFGNCDWHVTGTKASQGDLQTDNPTISGTIKSYESSFAPHLGTVRIEGDDNESARYNGKDVLLNLTWFSQRNGSQLNLWTIPSYGPSYFEASRLGPPICAPGIGEAIVYFTSTFPANNRPSVPCTLPHEFVSHFVNEQAPTRGEAALLHYLDPDTHRNLGEFQMYPEGFFTCVPNAGGIGPQTLPINGVFVFASWVSRCYPLKPLATVGMTRRLGIKTQ